MRQRLDILMVERGLAPSRRAAQAMIMSGRVAVLGRIQEKPGTRVAAEAEISVRGPARVYASRGGLKLAGALEAFGIDVAGMTAVDIGASTGGFTDCLLRRGAARVFAVDVGRGQIDWRLRNDPRVNVLEGINARYLSASDLPGMDPEAAGLDLAVIDVSFISLRLILPRVPPLLRPAPAPSAILALVKPQFEVGREGVGRGGIVRDPDLRRDALAGIAAFAASIGLAVRGMARSPITGAEGNREYFIHMTLEPGGLTPAEIEERSSLLSRDDEGGIP